MPRSFLVKKHFSASKKPNYSELESQTGKRCAREKRERKEWAGGAASMWAAAVPRGANWKRGLANLNGPSGTALTGWWVGTGFSARARAESFPLITWEEKHVGSSPCGGRGARRLLNLAIREDVILVFRLVRCHPVGLGLGRPRNKLPQVVNEGLKSL